MRADKKNVAPSGNWRWLFGRKPNPEFLPVRGNVPGFTNWAQSQHLPLGASSVAAYLEMLDAELKAQPGVYVTVESNDTAEAITAHLSQRNGFGLQFRGGNRRLALSAKNLSFVDVDEARGVELKNCRILRLRLASVQEVSIEDCDIGLLNFAGGIIGPFDLSRTSIRRLELHTDQIRGPFRLRNASLPTEADQTQALINLKAALFKIHNSASAGLVRAAELRIERRTEPLPIWLISALYDCLSAYGNSAWRPICWFGGFAALNFGLLAISGSTMPAQQLIGWETVLGGCGPSASLYRAAVMTLTQIFNPLGILARNPLVEATSPFIAALSSTICLLATTTLALFLLAVRRQIKLDA
jgi:hypothetical protein